MNRRIISFLSVILLLLSVAAVILLVRKNSQEEGKGEVRYAVTATAIVNNKAVVRVLAGVFAGRDLDPFNYVRLTDREGLPYYPINGFAKPRLSKGDDMEIEFEFFYPGTVECTLEIRDSQGGSTLLDVVFPELMDKEIVDIIAK